ncbi:MAG: hypothetical protein NUV91_02320 [Candidatus Omnitrophica bacterium]|nr:hypothetical protein [Candidatus Omnitrophota bacterium]
MKPGSHKNFIFFGISGSLLAIVIMSTVAVGLWNDGKKHEFSGKCQLCHLETPVAGTPFQEMKFAGTVDQMCAHCHEIKQQNSHPTNVSPRKPIPLQMFLDRENKLTCLTCHDVHKEEKEGHEGVSRRGLLRGHTVGRAFCATCHHEAALGAEGWLHGLALSYAHFSGTFTQSSQGAFLDRFSVECLSCHDGVISQTADVSIKAGRFDHSIGLSHSIGVPYPPPGKEREYVPVSQLPSEIQLFDGKLGCLSCHSPYIDKKSNLVLDNRGSALCFACHVK